MEMLTLKGQISEAEDPCGKFQVKLCYWSGETIFKKGSLFQVSFAMDQNLTSSFQ